MSTPRPNRPPLPLPRGGIVPPLVTPLVDRDTLDAAGAERLVEHVINAGVSGIFILGTNGEAPCLGYRLRREYIKLVCQLARARVPVLVGITDTAFVESVALAATARDCGASGVVLSMPYYFPVGQAELVQYVRRLCAELPLPVMLYNMPSLTKVWITPESLEELADIEKIAGVKDSGGDLEYYARVTQLKQRRPDWSVFMGPEHLLCESMRLGGDGGVHGGANFFPSLFVQCHDAVRAGDAARAAELHACIMAMQPIYDVGKYASRFVKATKCALSLLGICGDQMAEPFNHFLAPERARVEAILDEVRPRIAEAVASGR